MQQIYTTETKKTSVCECYTILKPSARTFIIIKYAKKRLAFEKKILYL